MDHMDRKPRKYLPGITAKRRRMRGPGVTPKCGGFSRVPRTHTVRVRIYVFLLSPPAPIRNKNEENKEDETQERCHLSARKVLPFSEFAATFLRKQTPICNPIVRIFIVTQITQIFFRPPDS